MTPHPLGTESGTRGQRPRTAFNDPFINGHLYDIRPRKDLHAQQIQILSKDVVRNLRTKSAKPPEKCQIVLTPSQLASIKQTAKKVEEASLSERHQEMKRRLQEAAEKSRQLRAALKKKERAYVHTERVPGSDKSEHIKLLETIKKQKIGNLEEAKAFNKLVLGMKCQAVRVAQVEEKKSLREREKEEDDKYASLMKKELEVANRKEEEKDKLRQEATRLTFSCLQNQIETQKKTRQQDFYRRRESDYQMALKKTLEYAEERRKEEEKRERMKVQEREEAQRINEEILKTKEEALKNEKLHNIKILNDLLKRQKKEDEEKEKEKTKRRFREDVSQFLLEERERQLREDKARAELKAQRIQEEEERAWRERVLQEVVAKKEKEEREKKERKIHLKEKQEQILMEKLQEVKMSQEKRIHSIITAEREEMDALKIRKVNFIKAKFKMETKMNLEEQMRIKEEIRNMEAQTEKKDQLTIAQQKRQEEEALVTLQEQTMDDLRKMSLSPKLLDELERGRQKILKNLKAQKK